MAEEREDAAAKPPEGPKPEQAEAPAAEGAETEAAARPAAEAPEAAPGKDLQREVDEWRNRALRSAADLDNMRKRALRERDDLRKFGIEGLLKDLLPVADNLERAVGHASAAEGALAEGVQMVLRQLTAVLEKNGAKPFDPKGEAFDPQFHEAMTQVPREDVEPGTVVDVFQRGWMLHDRLVRPAMVVIAKGADADA